MLLLKEESMGQQRWNPSLLRIVDSWVPLHTPSEVEEMSTSFLRFGVLEV